MPTQQEYLDLIASELSVTGDSTFTLNLSIWWSMYSTETDDTLHYLYAKRRAVYYLMGKVRRYVDQDLAGDKVSLSQQMKNLKIILEGINDEIKALGGDTGAPELVTLTPTTNGPDVIEETYNEAINGVS